MSTFFASEEWQVLLGILPTLPLAILETFSVTLLSTLMALVIGLPLGVLLVVARETVFCLCPNG